MEVECQASYRGLYFEGAKTFVIADLHLNRRRPPSHVDVQYPKTEHAALQTRVTTAIELLPSVKRLVINGDLFNGAPLTEEDTSFFADIPVDSIVGIHGNHEDNVGINLDTVESVTDVGDEYMFTQNGNSVYCTHGHTEKSLDRNLNIIGHFHPETVDGTPCYLIGEQDKTVVLPAFSNIVNGTTKEALSSFQDATLTDLEKYKEIPSTYDI